MKLYVMRHGEAVDAEAVGGLDEARSLTSDGAEKVRKAGSALARMQVEPEFIWTSPLLRAMQTATIIHESLSKAQLQVVDELHPSASIDALVQAIQTRGGSTLLIVGHNPNLEDLIFHLLKGGGGGGVKLKKGGIALLRVERPIKQDAGSLLQLWTPKYLGNLAG